MNGYLGRRLWKRALLTCTLTALLPLTYAGAAHATTTPDTSTIGGTISRAQVLNRLQYWVDQGVPYNQGAYHADLQGASYREDCSGYVSMGWHLGSNGNPDSETVFTSSPSLISSSTSTPISKADLKPGDIINMWVPGTTDGHTLIFDGWTDSTQTHYNAYEESNPNDLTHLAGSTTAFPAIPWPYWNGEYVGGGKNPNAQIGAYRYNKIASDIPAGFNVAINANGSSLTSGQSLSGTVNFTALASSQNIINYLSYTITGPNGYTTTITGTTGANNYATAWNTSGLADGTYTISATANEIDGQNHTYGPISFTANNAPAIPTFTAPTGLAYGKILLSASNISGNTAKVNYSVDGGGPVGYADASTGFSYTLDTTALANGTHTITAQAVNASGTPSGSTPAVTITVDNSPFNSNPVVAKQADGSLDVFALSPDKSQIMHRYQQGPNGAWTGWVQFGGAAAGPPVIGTLANGALDAFVLSADKSKIMHSYQNGPNGGWSGWAQIGNAADSISVARQADGSLDLFALAPDRSKIMHTYESGPNGGWGGWVQFGGAAATVPVFGTHADGSLDAFALSPDKSQIVHTNQSGPNGGWGTWVSFGTASDSIAVATDAAGNMNAFAVGPNGSLVAHTSQTAPAAGWNSWDTTFGGAVATR